METYLRPFLKSDSWTALYAVTYPIVSYCLARTNTKNYTKNETIQKIWNCYTLFPLLSIAVSAGLFLTGRAKKDEFILHMSNRAIQGVFFATIGSVAGYLMNRSEES